MLLGFHHEQHEEHEDTKKVTKAFALFVLFVVISQRFARQALRRRDIHPNG